MSEMVKTQAKQGLIVHRRGFLKGAAALFAGIGAGGGISIPAVSATAAAPPNPKVMPKEETLYWMENVAHQDGDFSLMMQYNILPRGKFSGMWLAHRVEWGQRCGLGNGSIQQRSNRRLGISCSRATLERHLRPDVVSMYLNVGEECIQDLHRNHGWPIPPDGRIVSLPWATK